MNIVAIMGSPKGKGHGYAVVKEIERHMKSMSKVKFEYIFLKDANFGLCKGCYSCALHGENKCPLQDDRALIEEKMLSADGLILSSPMYVLNVSWLMKNFMDRFVYTHHRPRFFGQKTMLVLNSHAWPGKKEAFSALQHALGGTHIIHKLHVITSSYLEHGRMARKKEKAIKKGAEKLFNACLDKQLPNPGVKDYLVFQISKITFGDAKEVAPANYDFYRDKDYYYDVNIGVIKKIVAGVVLPLVRLIIKAFTRLYL